MQATEKLIVALDVPAAADALKLVGALGDTVSFYKVGMQLYFAEGNALVKELLARKKQVFLDLKINDIPETVALAVASLARLGVDYLTLFTAEKQIAAARKVLDELKSPLKLLNVTVLTSDASGVDAVEQRAQLALGAGADGLICSGQETAALRARFGAGPIIVNPGIRPTGGEMNDQIRVVTPAMAVRAGATNIVVGRPITRAADPRAAAEAIVAEIQGA
ncbi:MAG: orotidine-5'-phosphate decarboxylase [Turneriella sp.]